jgi:hypothetical protein
VRCAESSPYKDWSTCPGTRPHPLPIPNVGNGCRYGMINPPGRAPEVSRRILMLSLYRLSDGSKLEGTYELYRPTYLLKCNPLSPADFFALRTSQQWPHYSLSRTFAVYLQTRPFGSNLFYHQPKAGRTQLMHYERQQRILAP